MHITYFFSSLSLARSRVYLFHTFFNLFTMLRLWLDGTHTHTREEFSLTLFLSSSSPSFIIISLMLILINEHCCLCCCCSGYEMSSAHVHGASCQTTTTTAFYMAESLTNASNLKCINSLEPREMSSGSSSSNTI
jgi:hypothetical protein